MPFPAGTSFGPYRLVEPIGAGGMGEVYRATDSRLERSVAIKVLPSHLSANAQLRERFEREARAISAISHPNICTLYDIGRENGTDYLVMEFLEGETLADRLAKGPLPVEQALRYGIEIAQALEKAHRNGIVHRDLKPGNIMITSSGAKLLDFGLACYARPEAVPDVSLGPTLVAAHKPLTQEGTILGTYQYMAPEQLEGNLADARTDIFALGAVLYEMVTGRRAFDGKTKTSLIAAIVSAEPPALAQIQPFAPSGLERVVKTCLAKDPDERWATAHDVALELKWIQREASQPEARAERARGRKVRRALPWALAALALLAAAAIAVVSVGRAAPPREVRFRFQVPAGSLHSLEVSPDGSMIAAVVREEAIVIRRLDGTVVRTIEGRDLSSPAFWSPDGKSLGYFSRFKLMRVDVEGGSAPQEIGEGNYGVGGAWLDDGTIVFAPQFGQGLFRVPATGGTPQPLTTLDPKKRESLHGWPRAVPGSDLVLYLRRTIAAETSEIHAIPAGGGAAVKVLEADALVGVTGRHLWFIRDASLWRQPFDARKRAVRGDAERVADRVLFREVWAMGPASVSRDESTIAFVEPLPFPVVMRWFDRSGKPLEDLATHEKVDIARLSPDGRLLATDRFDDRHGASDIWVHDLTRGIDSRLTTSRGSEEDPRWTPDGRSIIFGSDLYGLYEPWIVPADGSSEPKRLFEQLDGDTNVRSIAPDGNALLLEVWSTRTSNDIWVSTLAEPRAPRPFVVTESYEADPAFSPDGRWVVYSSGVSGKGEVYVRSFPAGDRLLQLSTGGARTPRWSPTGSEVFFLAQDKVMSVPLSPRGDALEAGVPRVLFTIPANAAGGSYEISPDGKRFLIPILTEGRKPNEIEVISRWPPR
ncbi:MAG: protein kinase domain-containing protein [Thermoanaerobaculia bacterium]